MNKAYVTFLATDDFLPGVLALANSLRYYGNNSQLVVIVSTALSEKTTTQLRISGLSICDIKQVQNPKEFNYKTKFKYTYSKLNIFGMTQYDKIVYLDADVLITGYIEPLFDVPHMSAVAAGKLVNPNWINFNSGMLVVTPDSDLFDMMLSSVPILLSNGGDQEFLHSFYPQWPQTPKLHLDHRYNVPFIYIMEYCQSLNCKFSFKKKVLKTDFTIIHYWGETKPWELDRRLSNIESNEKNLQALSLWWNMYLLTAGV